MLLLKENSCKMKFRIHMQKFSLTFEQAVDIYLWFQLVYPNESHWCRIPAYGPGTAPHIPRSPYHSLQKKKTDRGKKKINEEVHHSSTLSLQLATALDL